MRIERTRPDPSASPDGPPTYVTDDTHWWDGSQVYGRDTQFAEALRTGEHGKLRVDEHGLIPEEIESYVAGALARRARAGTDSRSTRRGALIPLKEAAMSQADIALGKSGVFDPGASRLEPATGALCRSRYGIDTFAV